MVDFKLTIADPKTGLTYQTEVKDQSAQQFIGLNIGESVKGDDFGLQGYELEITGGSDTSGFPMRKGILGVRKRITLEKGVGIRKTKKGVRKRKTVCGHKIHETISQINLKVTKEGSKKLSEVFGKTEKKEGKEEKPKPNIKSEKKEQNEPKKEVNAEIKLEKLE